VSNACRGIAYSQGQLALLDEARANIAEALEASAQAGDLYGQAHAYLDLAASMEAAGETREALGVASQALQLAEAGGTDCAMVRASALNAVGWYLTLSGRHAEAIGYCEEALAFQRQVGDLHMEPLTLDSLAYAHSRLGHHTEAAVYYRAAVDLFERLGYRFGRARALAYAGDAYRAADDVAAARDAWTQALAILDNMNDPLANKLSTNVRQLAADMTPSDVPAQADPPNSAGRDPVLDLGDNSAYLRSTASLSAPTEGA
jgi:tetratricopeptide (TPR) repeat protein